MNVIKTNQYTKYLKEGIIYFILSVFIHAQVFIHDILECDEFGIAYRDNYLWDISLGRFSAGLYDIITSFFGFSIQSTYYSIVIFSIIMSLALVIIFYLFDIKDVALKMFVAFTCLSFQSFMTINIFRCGIIRWALSFTFPCISAFILIKCVKQNAVSNHKKFLLILLSSVLLILGIGFTQAALSVFAVILLLDLVNDSIDGFKIKKIFVKAIYYFIFILISSVLYLILMSSFHKLFNLSFSRNYADIKTIAIGLFKSYARYAWLIVTSSRLLKAFYVFLYLIIIYEFIVIYVQKKTNKLMLLLFSLLIPLATGLAGLMQKGGAPIRAWFALVIIFIIPIYFYQKIKDKGIKINLYNLRICLVIALLGHAICNFYNTQSYYQSHFSSNEATKAFAIELAATIKKTEGYSTDKKFCIVGNPGALTKDGFTSDLGKSNLMAVSWTFVDGLKKYGAIDFELVDDNIKKELINSNEVKNMPLYPNEGSIKVIDDVVVIKIAN